MVVSPALITRCSARGLAAPPSLSPLSLLPFPSISPTGCCITEYPNRELTGGATAAAGGGNGRRPRTGSLFIQRIVAALLVVMSGRGRSAGLFFPFTLSATAELTFCWEAETE